METRGVVASYTKSDKSLPSGVPHRYLICCATFWRPLVGLPQHQVHVIVPEVGGGFGCKLNIYPEEMVAAFAAMKPGVPSNGSKTAVKISAATIHGRDQVDYVEIAATRDGKIRA